MKAVVFDADGMMILGDRPSLRLVRDYGVPQELVNKFFENEFKPCVLGQSDLKKAVAPYLKLWGWKGTMDEFLHFWFAQSYKVDERLREAVAKLRAEGIKCILATNQEKYRVQFMKNEMDLAEIFDAIVASSDIGVKKPSPLFFDALMKVLPGVEEKEVVFWDDRPDSIDAAKAYGFQAELFSGTDAFLKRMNFE